MTLISHQQKCLSKDKKKLAKQYYQEGLTFYEDGKCDSAINRFKKALGYDRKLADAHNKLALIYMDQGTVYSRFLAGVELEKALRLDWNNPEYRFNNALLYLKKDMAGLACREFQKVIKLEPDNYMAYYHIGVIKEKDVMRYRDMVDPEEDGIIFFRKFAEKDKDKAVYYLNKAIAINPYFTEVYYRLGLIYYEFNETAEMINLLEKAIKINPKDKNCHLFLGFAYYQHKDYALAQTEYEEAIKLMLPYERQIFDSIDLIMTPEQKAEFDSVSSYKQKKMEEIFWKNKDPFLLTEFNERKLEHYSRIAYANLRYSIPEKNIEGWQTDQGKIYIRYGKPITLFRTRPDIDVASDGGYSSMAVTFFVSKEYWSYPDFNYVFEDRFLSQKYEFAWGNTPETDYRSVYETMIKEKPDYYEYIPKNKKLEIATDFAKFRGQDEKTLVGVSFAILADSIFLVLRDQQWQTRIKQGIFLYDDEWKKKYKSINDYNWIQDQITTVGREKYFIDQSSISVPPGSYNIALEIHDLESDRRQSLRMPIEITSFNTQELQLSDIQLAFNITPDSAVKNFSHDNLKILPNPLKQFLTSTPISIYYEIYNLSQANDGLTSFRVENTISSNREKIGRIKKILSRLKLTKLSGEVTTSYKYEGNSPTEYQYQTLELSHDRTGYLTLFVKVTDLHSNQTVTKTVEFKIDSQK